MSAPPLTAPRIERVSVEPSRRCSKGCSFCYNGSGPTGDGAWTAADLIAFGRSCAEGGVRALSLGGGEPLEWEGTFAVLAALRGVLFCSLTTSGLPLRPPGAIERLAAAAPDKVHVSIHAPENPREVARVVAQVEALAAAGVRSGVNLLVRRSRLGAAAAAARALADAGIGRERVILLPLRGAGGADTPSPAEVAQVAGAVPGDPSARFQSMSCLRACGPSPRFASVAADRTAAWCSYTITRRPLAAPTHAALLAALDGLGLRPCQG